jgi:glycosyltransferase involved in cell wall biosynthesis
MGHNLELITIIVPIYNVEKYLHKCILSITSQTYKNLEIILVDDGSPDNCPAICDQYAINDSRIKVIHKINGGLSSARNAGLDIATGKYVLFVDSDDSITEECIEVLYDSLKKTNSQIAVGNILIVNSEDFPQRNEMVLNEMVQVLSSKEAILNIYTEGLKLQFITVWGNLYEMDLFKTLRFPEGKINEDEFLNYKLFYLSKRIVYTPSKIYNYLIRIDSIMKSNYSLNRLDFLEALEERILFFENLTEFKILSETLNFYFHHLLGNLRKVRREFPHEKIIHKNLLNKFLSLSKKIILSNDMSIRKKIMVIKYLFFPFLHKMNL